MKRPILLAVAIGLGLSACTADPDAPINQTTPIRQMDQFFGQPARRPAYARPPDYTHDPGYAPAYPPYDAGTGS